MSRDARRRPLLAPSLLALAVTGAALAASCAAETDPEYAASAQCLAQAGDLYEQRIAPLFATDRPRTCNQCHLSGVDLTLFVRDDICETRACLLELGLVDPKNPEDSVILSWIARAQPDSALITEEVIQEEYDAFASFVERIATCGGKACAGTKCPATSDGERCDSEASEPSGARIVAKDTPCDSLAMEAAFRETVYVWRDRCFPCHHSNQLDAAPNAPRWLDVHSGCDAGSISTLHYIESHRYLNLEHPEQSLLLLKPLSVESGGIEHEGGQKFYGTSDPSYVSWLSFIEYYAACKTGAATP